MLTIVPFGGYNFYSDEDKKKSDGIYGFPGKRRYNLNPQLAFF